MAADGSIIIDTKIDDSGIPKKLGKMKTSLAQAAKTLALPVAIAAGAIAAVGKVVSLMGEMNKLYMVQVSAERALAQAAANNPYLTGESVNNLKRYASELQKVSNYGDEVTIGLMTQLAAAGRTESEIQSIIKASADLAASGTTTFDGAVKNLNKTYSGLSGELGEVIPELKTLTAEQMKNGDAVDLIAKKYAGMALSVVDKSVQIQNGLGDLKEAIGEIGASTGLTDIFQNSLLAITEWYASGIRMFNDWVSRMRGTKEYSIDVLKQTRDERIALMLEERKKVKEINDKLNETTDTNTRNYLTQAFEERMTELNRIQDGITMLNEEISQKEKELAEENKKTIITNGKEKTDALIKAYSEWEAAQARANKAAEMGVTTQDEQMQELKRAAQEYQEKLVDITLQYGALGEAATEAFNKAQGITKDPVIPRGSPIGGPVMPTGTSSTTISMILDLIAAANDGGDAAGKALTNSMASAIDNTSIGVSESIGAVMDNIGAAITIAIAVVKKIFAGIKAVAKFDPMAMYESFLDIIDGLTSLFDKISTLPIYIKAGKEILFEFAKGMLENREKNAEIFRNVLVYMLETAKEVIPAMITLALLLLTDFAVTIISQLPMIIDTAFAIITALAVGILDALPALILAAGDILPALLYSIITGIPMFYLAVIEHLPEIFTAIINAVIGMLPELTMAIIQAWIQSMYIMPALIIAALVGLLLEVVVNLITDIYNLGTPVGFAIWEGIWQGIKDGWAKFAEDVRKAFKSIGDMFKDMFEINSPSKVFWRFGVNLMDGLKNAILGYDLWGKISGKFTELRGKVSDALSGIKDTLSTVATTVGGVISDGVSDAVDWVKGLFNAEGTNNFRGGTAIINEEGAEMVTLPSGSKIMTASATAQMQDRAISQLLAGMKTPTFAVAGSGGNRNINISTKVDAPMIVDGAMLGRLVFQNIDRAVI